MTGTSRQQRRKLLRERFKAGQQALTRGLPEIPRRAEIVAAAEVLRAKLAEGNNVRRAREAAEIAHGLGERSLRAHPGSQEIACRIGCSYCCHGLVAVTAPEAFRIADLVSAGKAGGLDAAEVRRRALPLRGLTAADRIGRKLPCPLLVDGRCSVYAARPLVCRQTTSLSLPACVEEFEGIDPEGRIAVSSAHLSHASNAHVVLLGAMLAMALPTTACELGAALEIVLADPDCERRWLAGEDVLAPAPGRIERSPDVDRVAAAIARDLVAD